MIEKLQHDNVSIVLHRPRYPENIGAAARAMRNMGISQLIVVQPENPDMNKIMRLATHAASEIIDNMRIFDSLSEALALFQYIVGTTARLGGERQRVKSPDTIGEALVSISQQNKVALLFGSEDRGLTNKDIRYCHCLVNIPTAEFSSINLAQSVMILCYELFKAESLPKRTQVPRLASRQELDGMYDQLKDILIKISYIQPDNPDYWMNKFRHFFSRLQLRAGEVSIIRGICRQINWFGKKSYEDGFNANPRARD